MSDGTRRIARSFYSLLRRRKEGKEKCVRLAGRTPPRLLAGDGLSIRFCWCQVPFPSNRSSWSRSELCILRSLFISPASGHALGFRTGGSQCCILHQEKKPSQGCGVSVSSKTVFFSCCVTTARTAVVKEDTVGKRLYHQPGAVPHTVVAHWSTSPRRPST